MGTDILILTVYFIIIVYVLYQMALSFEARLEDQVNIQLDGDTLKTTVTSQLQQQGWEEVIEAQILPNPPKPLEGKPCLAISIPQGEDQTAPLLIQVLPQGTKPPKPPIPLLTVQVLNGVPDTQVFIDWDSSSITLHNIQARRVIRQIPGMTLDIAQPQVYSTINPGQFLTAAVTCEDALGRNKDTQVLEVSKPLVDLERAMMMPDPARTFSLRLTVWLQKTNRQEEAIRLLIPFNFKIAILPGRAAFPILSWILDR